MKNSRTKISGATSYKETAFGIISRSKLVRLEAEGVKRGLDFLYKLAKRERKVKITPQIICKLHKVSFGLIFPQWAGSYRAISVTCSGKTAPSQYRIAEFVTNLCSDIEERLKHLPSVENEQFIIEVVQLLAWFQHRFVTIHPFQDYNGRTARMLTTFVLLQLMLPPIEIKAETKADRKRYLVAMQRADNGDFSLLEELLSIAIVESMERFQKKII